MWNQNNPFLYDIMALHTGMTAAQLKTDSDRDKYMSAEMAADYGLIDKVLVSKPKVG